jgi:transposase
MSKDVPLPTTVAELQALVLEQQASIANMVREIAARDDEIERLKAQIDKLRRMYFGSKSEKLARQIDKLEARLEDLTAGQGAAQTRWQRDGTSKAPPGRAPTREPLPPHLPRDEVELTPNPACPRCAAAMQRAARQTR